LVILAKDCSVWAKKNLSGSFKEKKTIGEKV
jgi:hypothetical protein